MVWLENQAGIKKYVYSVSSVSKPTRTKSRRMVVFVQASIVEQSAKYKIM